MSMSRVMILLICGLLTFDGVYAADDSLAVECPATNFCVAVDGLPEGITPDRLYRLFVFLGENVELHEDGELAGAMDRFPVVLRFVDAQVTGRFPESAETYGGMVGLASWNCAGLQRPSAASTDCRVWATDESSGESSNLVIAVITRAEDQNETLGLAAHELTHVFGAVDGTRCPYNENYLPYSMSGPDPSDSYWWYGVTGVFSLQPAGLVWDALGHRCAATQSPEWCGELERILTTGP